MRIYIAAKWEKQSQCRILRAILQHLKHTVTAQWLDEPAECTSEEAAIRDLKDIDRSDAVVVVNQDEGGCGMWVEMGYALAQRKRVYLLGKNFGEARRTDGGFRSVFHHLPEVILVEDVLALEKHI